MKNIRQMTVSEIETAKETIGKIYGAIFYNPKNQQLSDIEEFYPEILNQEIEAQVRNGLMFQKSYTRNIVKPLVWQEYDKQNGYVIWKAIERETNRAIFQVTKGEKPTNDAGYYNVNYLYNIKRLNKIGTV